MAQGPTDRKPTTTENFEQAIADYRTAEQNYQMVYWILGAAILYDYARKKRK